MKNQNFYLLNMNQETKKVFSPQPMLSFRSSPKIYSYLVRAKLYPFLKLRSTPCKAEQSLQGMEL